MTLQVGSRFGHYDVTARIGESGRGPYKAEMMEPATPPLKDAH